MFFNPERVLQTDFSKARPNGTKLLGDASNISKIGATSYETIQGGYGIKRARNTSNIVRKGPFKGMRCYTLTLPERNSCPTSCEFYEKLCYGRNMPFSKRVDHTHPQFLETLADDVAVICKRPVVIRLHELGDFFSVEYVRFWEEMLETHANLNVFGYSHQTGDIGRALTRVFKANRERFVIYDSEGRSTVRPHALSEERSAANHPSFITCPQQTGKTPGCVTCGLCMNGKLAPNIRFLVH